MDALGFALLSPRERTGCALLWLAVSDDGIGESTITRTLRDHIQKLRMDRLSATAAVGNLSYFAAAPDAAPAWLRAAYAIFQFALESGDGWDEALDLPEQIDLADPDFDAWLETTRHPAFWHILVEHHVELLSPRALRWIFSQPACDIGTAASFVFRFGHLRQTAGATRDVVETLFATQTDLPRCTAKDRTDILFSLFQRAERHQFGVEKYSSAYGLSCAERYALLEALGDQVETASCEDFPLPIVLLTRSLADREIASPYMLVSHDAAPELYRRPVWLHYGLGR